MTVYIVIGVHCYEAHYLAEKAGPLLAESNVPSDGTSHSGHA